MADRALDRRVTAAIGILVILQLDGWRVSAQEIGVRGGLSIARLYDRADPAKEISMRGFSGGVSVGIPSTDVFSVRPELQYVQKGTSLGDSAGIETLHAVDYLEFSLLLNLSVPPTKTMYFGFVFGPAVAFEVRERIKTTGSIEQSVDVDRLKDVDVCAAAGLELYLRSGPGHWSLDCRYTFGLYFLERPGGVNELTRTGTTVIALGYAFPLGDRRDQR